MKRIITLICFVAIAALHNTALAQTEHRTWSQGPLTWDDFTLMSKGGNEQAYLQYELSYTPVHDTIDGILSHYYLAEACMLPNRSWVVADHRTPELLRYNQVIFDMLEVERRTLQRSLNTSDNPRDYENMLYAADDRLNTRIASFRIRTQDGSDTTDLATFEKQIRHELSMLPAHYQPTYTPHPFGFAAYFSIGASCHLGTMGQDFTPGLAIGYGFDFLWKRHVFNIEMYMGYSDARRTLALYDNSSFSQASHTFEKGKAYNNGVINVGYGYLLIDNTHFQLAPTAAFSIRNLSTVRNQTERFEYTRLEPAIGLMFRYHFWQQNSFAHYSALFGSRRISERDRISLHGKLMLSYSSFPRIDGGPSGINLMAQVGLAFGGRYHHVE